MVKLSEINRTAAISWSQGSLPLLATGTLAGAVDADFSSSSALEIWDVLDPSKKEPVAQDSVSNRFHSLTWSAPFENYDNGLLAGAFEDGNILLWDAAKFISSSSLQSSLVHECKKHTGPVKTLAFNPLQSHVLASGGSRGEIFIWDTKKLSPAMSPGKAMSPLDEVTSIAWNNSMSHIFASAGNTGYGSIWDLKAKKEVLHLSYTGPSGRANLTSIAWHPTQSTKLVTASDSDGTPVILTWDLRNSNVPETIMTGHKKGVLSLDWCKQDPELLLSSGKDNSTFLWNPVKGIKLGEYPSLPNWAFETRFAPKLPEVFATASFDKKITIQSLQDTSPPVSQQVNATSEVDFWSEISHTETQQPEFTVKQAPKWLQCPVGASFGFGGKIVVFSPKDGKSSVKIEKYAKDEKLDEFVTKLSTALKDGDFNELCSEKETTAAGSKDWKLLKELLEVGKLELLKKKIALEPVKDSINGNSGEEDKVAVKAPAETDDDFFSSLGTTTESSFIPPTTEFTIDGAFKVFESDESDAVKEIKLDILKGDLDKAVSLCVKDDKIMEALVLSLVGSENAKKAAKDAYFKKYAEKSSLARILYSVSNNDLSDVVKNGDLKNWKEIASAIVAHSSGESYSTYFVEIGERLIASDIEDAREIAISFFIAADALDKVSEIWLSELSNIEASFLKSSEQGASSPADARFLALREVVEKVMVYRSISKDVRKADGEGLKSLTDAYLEFSDLLSTYGHYDLSLKLLGLIPESAEVKLAKQRLTKATNVPVTQTSRNVGYGAKSKASYTIPSANAKAASTSAYTAPRVQSPANAFVPVAQQSYGAPQGYPSYPQQPAAFSASPVPAKPALHNPYLPSAPMNALESLKAQPAKSVSSPPPPALGVTYPQYGYQAGASATPPPPPKSSIKRDAGGWNDLPSHIATAQPRRTPVATPAASSVYDYQQVQANSQSQTQPPVRSASQPMVVPPPPRSLSRQNTTNSPAAAGAAVAAAAPPKPTAPPARPSNRYAPPPQLQSELPAATGSNGNGVPSSPVVAAPPNPYAPRQQKQETGNSFSLPPQPISYNNQVPLSPTSSVAPPPPRNPYAPRQQETVIADNSGFAPPPPQTFTPPAYHHAAPPQAREEVPPPPPSKKKFPAGDRSHIPVNALPIFEILDAELQKVKPKIPEKYAKQVTDAEKRLNILYDHLNNGDLLSEPTVAGLVELSKALASGDYATAQAIQTDIATNHVDECGNWMVGVKRLVTLTSRSQ
ncbi:unnamed protein product [Kuraishia capsulata CBS 1993]|uniref:Protein transport protein SEC31 n=1 Tax=Kuraishia capsulata CBS 1993 TaxID=1382522 RepID=W6MXP9_9ASCO|nr:uncharacterized protein KUCA_T00005258001 [Kuraishia capsulata CBS 1993]CDK29270.1 unnamed protein product [Kuraishia capsulata CBS 1993]